MSRIHGSKLIEGVIALWALLILCAAAQAQTDPLPSRNEGAAKKAIVRIQWLAGGALAVLVLAFAVTFDFSILARSNLHERPWALVFPAIGALALAGLAVGVHRQRHDAVAFAMTVVFSSPHS